MAWDPPCILTALIRGTTVQAFLSASSSLRLRRVNGRCRVLRSYHRKAIILAEASVSLREQKAGH